MTRRRREHERLAGPVAAKVRGSEGGIGRPSSPTAERVSDDLRRHAGTFLDRRRRVAALSLGASAAMGVVAAYQNGLLRHLPEPPLGLLDADRVDASGEAYQFLKTPDGALGLASYALTLVLAGAGTARRAEERPWLPLALAAKVAADALGGLYLTAEQASKHRRFCSWCVAAAFASVAMVPQVVPEARAALRQLHSNG
ncbi:MAG: vitamin K epoxide reductase family protein [Actinomycetota bacterium]|nr:vitamin K epoxide reductase family protein [Actinomycetota bacterium]